MRALCDAMILYAEEDRERRCEQSDQIGVQPTRLTQTAPASDPPHLLSHGSQRLAAPPAPSGPRPGCQEASPDASSVAVARDPPPRRRPFAMSRPAQRRYRAENCARRAVRARAAPRGLRTDLPARRQVERARSWSWTPRSPARWRNPRGGRAKARDGRARAIRRRDRRVDARAVRDPPPRHRAVLRRLLLARVDAAAAAAARCRDR